MRAVLWLPTTEEFIKNKLVHCKALVLAILFLSFIKLYTWRWLYSPSGMLTCHFIVNSFCLDLFLQWCLHSTAETCYENGFLGCRCCVMDVPNSNWLKLWRTFKDVCQLPVFYLGQTSVPVFRNDVYLFLFMFTNNVQVYFHLHRMETPSSAGESPSTMLL